MSLHHSPLLLLLHFVQLYRVSPAKARVVQRIAVAYGDSKADEGMGQTGPLAQTRQTALHLAGGITAVDGSLLFLLLHLLHLGGPLGSSVGVVENLWHDRWVLAANESFRLSGRLFQPGR